MEGEEGRIDKGNSPPQPFFHYKGKNTLMKTYLLGYFSVAEDVVLVIQGARAASKQGFTGQLGMPNFLIAFGKTPLVSMCHCLELPGTCLTLSSLLPVISE